MPPFTSHLVELKNLDLDGVLDPEALVWYATQVRAFQSEFTLRSLTVPEWLDNRARELTREIQRRNSDALQARLKELEAREAALMTTQEKRDAVRAEKEAILAAMGAGTAAPPK